MVFDDYYSFTMNVYRTRKSDLVYTFIFPANRSVGWFEDRERATCFAMQIASSLGTRFNLHRTNRRLKYQQIMH